MITIEPFHPDLHPVGTATYYDGCPQNSCEWYQRQEVSRFGQFALEPSLQKADLALDTSEKASHPVASNQKKGFRFIQIMQWNDVNYRSVVMSKTLR